jgi:RNA polymerase sigma-70 factor (ECF subfamily)
MEEYILNQQDQFLKLFLKHQNDIKAFILSMVRDRHACEDLLQEVAIILWQKLDSYDPERSFRAWARGIAAKKIMQSFEKSKRSPVVFSPEAISAILDAYDKTDKSWEAQVMEKEALKLCIETLPGKSRSLLSQRYEKSLKLREMAEQFGKTLDAVHKALSRIRTALRLCIERRLSISREGG